MSASRIQRKVTTKKSQDRMHRQRTKELERRDGLSAEELIRRAILREKEEMSERDKRAEEVLKPRLGGAWKKDYEITRVEEWEDTYSVRSPSGFTATVWKDVNRWYCNCKRGMFKCQHRVAVQRWLKDEGAARSRNGPETGR